ALVALAGPMANFLIAAGAVGVHSLLGLWTVLPGVANLAFFAVIALNLILAVFNLLPIVPLDGGRIAAGLLPRKIAYEYSKIEPYGFFAVMLLVMS
ncbi:MAG: site-2 protease family protein, partial [Elusimicrobiota bacterium]